MLFAIVSIICRHFLLLGLIQELAPEGIGHIIRCQPGQRTLRWRFVKGLLNCLVDCHFGENLQVEIPVVFPYDILHLHLEFFQPGLNLDPVMLADALQIEFDCGEEMVVLVVEAGQLAAGLAFLLLEVF
jgi:hypothetical protein